MFEPEAKALPFQVLPELSWVIVSLIELAAAIPLVASVAVPAIGAPDAQPAAL